MLTSLSAFLHSIDPIVRLIIIGEVIFLAIMYWPVNRRSR